MNGKDEEKDGICILSFDCGGPGTYSQLLILKEYMSRIASDLKIAEDEVYPADHFDLMGGVGFGGLVALMLGFLRMNVNEAIDNLLEITSTVFLEGSQENLDVEVNAKNLKDAIENTLQARGIPFDTKLNDETRTAVGCKVALYAASSVQLSHPHIFRTYPSRETALNLTIAEAIRATISVPSYFSPVKINLPEGQKSFIGGGFGANNPTRLLLEEASMVFRKHRRVAQILSLGCGLPRVLAIGPSNEVHKLLQDVAADCEAVAHELSTRPFSTSTYLRLNVDRGMEAIAMRDWDDLGAIESHAAAYVANIDISRAIERSLRHIKERTGIVDLGQLNESFQ